MRRISLVTIDATNTIFKFREPPPVIYKKFADQHNIPICDSHAITPDFLKAISGVNKKWPHFGATSNVTSKDWWFEVIFETFKDYDRSVIKPLAKDLYDFYATPEPYDIFEDFYPFAKEWKEKSDKGLVVISNYDRRLPRILNQLGLANFFDDVITSEEAKVSKPSPEIFDYVIKKIKFVRDPTEILHIGDDFEKDFHGATKAGWNGALVNRKKESDVENDVFNSLKDISDHYFK